MKPAKMALALSRLLPANNHACGYALADKEHDTRALQPYLGHRNIQHTVRYTAVADVV